MAVYKGSCLCGAITYTLTGEPVTTVLCHCRNCQKSSGSSFQANLFYKQEVDSLFISSWRKQQLD
ncbi:unnamed protein product [Periconia digitata]|uniref:CENP-V/GFA domain-containing protein n=1 Tax=Periconia digitata TaxID=1303443 RepID=A0A9W4XIS3_9PLEO|nr:unnamed protein product [Periconia digitata]